MLLRKSKTDNRLYLDIKGKSPKGHKWKQTDNFYSPYADFLTNNPITEEIENGK